MAHYQPSSAFTMAHYRRDVRGHLPLPHAAAPAASADTTDKCKTATCDNPAEKKKNYGFCAACS
jgi:hypothetical protein